MPDGEHKISAHEKVGFPEQNLLIVLCHLGRAQHDKKRVAVRFYFGPLVGPVGIFNGQVMKAELLLGFGQQLLVGLMQTYPDKLIFLAQQLADVGDLDIGQPGAIGICRTINDCAHFSLFVIRYSLFVLAPNGWSMTTDDCAPLGNGCWP
jgi:hypothetical protein